MSVLAIHEAIVNELKDGLMRELTGRDMGDLFQAAVPSRNFPVGNISPEVDTIDGGYPSSCGFSTKLIGKKGSKAKVVVRGHVYLRGRPNLEEQLDHLRRYKLLKGDALEAELKAKPRVLLPFCWRYLGFEREFEVEKGAIGSVIDISDCIVDAWKESGIELLKINKEAYGTAGIEAQGKFWSSEGEYNNWLNENFKDDLPSIKDDQVYSLVLESSWSDDSFKVFVTNRSKCERFGGWNYVDQVIYGVTFEAFIPDGVELVPTRMTLEDTFNASAMVDSLGEGRNLHLRMKGDNILLADPFGLWRTNRIFPRESLGKADLSFKSLAKDPIPTTEYVVGFLEDVQKRYQELDKQYNSDQSKMAFKKITEVVERCKSGLSLLKSDVNMRNAFILMNETFFRRYARDERINQWRGFQFVYILGKLKHIIESDENTFDVIFVSTGGGKTETYFGLLITALFYYRYNKINCGTVAIIKFPLRMLAIDQIRRISSLIAVGDMVRREHSKLVFNEFPYWMSEFSVGFAIGGSSSATTPNRVHSYGDSPDLYSILTEKPEEIALLGDCPVCSWKEYRVGNKEKESYGDVEVSFDRDEVRARHECSVCGTRFAIHWTDEECFRYLPSIIISTQDRVAYGAFAPHLRGILGSPLYYCPDHGFSIYHNSCAPFRDGKGGYGKLSKKCPHLKNNSKLNAVELPPSDRALRFVIQDEMHLLKSDLGALNSPFEKMVADIVSHYSGRGIQYIGMSATVQGVQKQISEIYGCDRLAWVFPGDPPCQDFSKPISVDPFFKYSDDLHRIFIGTIPASGEPSTVVYRAIGICNKLVHKWESPNIVRGSLPASLIAFPKKEVAKALRYYRVNLGFMRTKIDLERTRQNHTKITNAERRNLIMIDKGVLPEMVVEDLTGDHSIKKIREIMKKIDRMHEEEPDEPIDTLLATNLISHGVDLKQMNIMHFYGIPGSNSEYLQSFSRVGRVYPGLVLVVYHNKRARDRGLMRTFHIHHGALRQQVETMPVDHLAPGLIDQTLVTLLRNYWYMIAETEISTQERVLYSLSQIVTHMNSPQTELIMGLPASKRITCWLDWDPVLKNKVRNRVREYSATLKIYHDRIKRRGGEKKKYLNYQPPISATELYREVTDRAKTWMATMTGIRGIQAGLTFYPTKDTKIYLETEGLE